MAIGAITRLYQRLGRRYPFTFLAIELQSALVVVAGTLGLLTFYYEGSLADYLLILAITLVLTEAAIIATLLRARPLLRTVSDWIGGERDPEATERAWAAAVSIPLHLVKRDLPGPVVASAVPSCVAGVLILDLTGWSLIPLFAVSAISIGYGMVLHYLAVEAGMRPVLVEINSCLSPPKSADFWAVPLRTKLLVSLPLINLITGLVVAALTSDGGGGANLGLDVLVALLVATTISLELTVMLSKSILRPVARPRARGRAPCARAATTSRCRSPPATSSATWRRASTRWSTGSPSASGCARRSAPTSIAEVAEYILSEGFDRAGGRGRGHACCSATCAGSPASPASGRRRRSSPRSTGSSR